MLTIILLIIAVSFDAMSFGIAQGLKNIKISFLTDVCMSVLSTVFFSVPLYLSQFVVKYLSEFWMDVINGIILILLGVYYFVIYFIEIRKTNKSESQNKEDTPVLTMKLSTALLATFPISIDAIFTAFLNGYSLEYIIFGVIFYFVITFLSIYITNIIGIKLSHKTNFNLGFLSAFIFILIGVLKLFGI